VFLRLRLFVRVPGVPGSPPTREWNTMPRLNRHEKRARQYAPCGQAPMAKARQTSGKTPIAGESVSFYFATHAMAELA
jgi:hypothetical protein